MSHLIETLMANLACAHAGLGFADAKQSVAD